MDGITLKDKENALWAQLTPKQRLILKKLAVLVGSGDQPGEFDIGFAALLGEGFTLAEKEIITARISGIKGIVGEARSKLDHIHIRLAHEAMPLFHKLALQAEGYASNGKGEKICEAALTLKRAFGVTADVEYNLEFTNEHFNTGEDVSHLDTAFIWGDRWRMVFADHPADYLLQEIGIRPMADNTIGISQYVSFQWPGSEKYEHNFLDRVSLEDFTAPDRWRKLIPGLLEKSARFLEEAKERLRADMTVRTDKGEAIRKDILLREMKEVCQMRDKLCEVLAPVSETRVIPEWPAREEPHGYFREHVSDLADFQSSIGKLDDDTRCGIESYIAKLWVNLFMREYCIRPETLDDGKNDWVMGVKELKEKYPEKAVSLEPKFQESLAAGSIRIAWGLHTRDFRIIKAFVTARLYQPDIGVLELPMMGWHYPNGLNRDEMRRALDKAIWFALSNDLVGGEDVEFTDDDIAQICEEYRYGSYKSIGCSPGRSDAR